MKSLAHPDYKPVLKAAKLTPLERRIIVRAFSAPHIGMLAIGKLNGMSDAEARMHFDNAIDKLSPHWRKANTGSSDA